MKLFDRMLGPCYPQSMRLPLLICLAMLGLVVSAQAAGSDYLGADRCGSCHESELNAWRVGPHQGAFKSVAQAGGKSGCASCHNTGDAPAGASLLPGVQCEACHGAGKHYAAEDIMRNPALTRALGLRSLSTPADREALCMRCHTARASLKAFDVEKAWAEIAH